MPRLQNVSISDWIDLRSSEEVDLKKGEYAMIDLGIAMHLPTGYEAYVVPRSSTYKKYKIIQTNGMGIIDNSYCGDNDWWKMPVLAMEDTHIGKYDRICQFRIMPKQGYLLFSEKSELGNTDRGGFGSTGVK
jgi:dUTP pyrophosphatase